MRWRWGSAFVDERVEYDDPRFTCGRIRSRQTGCRFSPEIWRRRPKVPSPLLRGWRCRTAPLEAPPQGGPLPLLLANIVLDPLDERYDPARWATLGPGRSTKGSMRRSTKGGEHKVEGSKGGNDERLICWSAVVRGGRFRAWVSNEDHPLTRRLSFPLDVRQERPEKRSSVEHLGDVPWPKKNRICYKARSTCSS